MVCLLFQLPKTVGVVAVRRSSAVATLGLMSSGVIEYTPSRAALSGFQLKNIFLLSSLQLTPVGWVPIHFGSRIIFSTVSFSSFWACTETILPLNSNRVKSLFIVRD